MNCQINDLHIKRQTKKQTKQDKSKPINRTNNIPNTNNKTNQETDYVITWPGMRANRKLVQQHKK